MLRILILTLATFVYSQNFLQNYIPEDIQNFVDFGIQQLATEKGLTQTYLRYKNVGYLSQIISKSKKVAFYAYNTYDDQYTFQITVQQMHSGEMVYLGSKIVPILMNLGFSQKAVNFGLQSLATQNQLNISDLELIQEGTQFFSDQVLVFNVKYQGQTLYQVKVKQNDIENFEYLSGEPVFQCSDRFIQFGLTKLAQETSQPINQLRVLLLGQSWERVTESIAQKFTAQDGNNQLYRVRVTQQKNGEFVYDSQKI